MPDKLTGMYRPVPVWVHNSNRPVLACKKIMHLICILSYKEEHYFPKKRYILNWPVQVGVLWGLFLRTCHFYKTVQTHQLLPV